MNVRALILLLVSVLTTGCTLLAPPQNTASEATPLAASSSATSPGSALATLNSDAIPVKGRAPKTGYDRIADFGPAWYDVDHNGCDTRNDVLKIDLAGETLKPGTHDCVVLTGTLDPDPYTGKVIEFKRGVGTSDDVQIDHIVPLSDAWQKGAQSISFDERRALANDPINLQATDGPTNSAKGDKDAATWLPPQRGYWCTYVARQITVKAKYHLWVTQAEHDKMSEILATCPDEPLAVAG
jgi:hypothetical protein